MGDLFEKFSANAEVSDKHQTINEMAKCEKAYGELIREYKDEFDYVQNSLKELREEERKFYKEDLPEIIDVLKADDVREEARQVWVDELKENMEKSFKMSEELLNSLAIKQMKEFRQEAEKIIKEGI